MCYAIPGRVTALEGKNVTVDYFGEKKKAINEIAELKIGDYIYAQGGFVIQTVSEREAVETLETWKELFFQLRATDLRLSRLDPAESGIERKISVILDRAAEGKGINKEEALALMRLEKPAEIDYLYKIANFLRQKYLSNSCCVHGIIEFSNFCRQNCAYCGIRAGNNSLNRYRMSEEEIMSAVTEAVDKHGFKALVLQSGEDPEFPPERLAKLIREIKQKHALLIFISVGEVGEAGLRELYEAGARGVLMRFETSDPRLYAAQHCGDLFSERVKALESAYQLGYLILTGGLIGLPGQTKESLIEDIFLAKKLHAEMFTFGPVLPSEVKPELVLKVLAISRLIDPQNAKIVVTTGFETLDKNARRLGLLAGASSVMLNVTPLKFRKLYNIYRNRAHEDETIETQIKETLELLYALGRAPTDLGSS